jgi:hypothetical protein
MKADARNGVKPTDLLDVVSKLFISALAVTWIGWQLYSGLKMSNDDQWPFTGYPMYSETRKIGDPIVQPKLIGYTLGGRQVEIAPRDLKISYHALNMRLYERSSKDVLSEVVIIYNRARSEPQEHISRIDLVYEGWVYDAQFPLQPYKKTHVTYEVPK